MRCTNLKVSVLAEALKPATLAVRQNHVSCRRLLPCSCTWHYSTKFILSTYRSGNSGLGFGTTNCTFVASQCHMVQYISSST